MPQEPPEWMHRWVVSLVAGSCVMAAAGPSRAAGGVLLRWQLPYTDDIAGFRVLCEASSSDDEGALGYGGFCSVSPEGQGAWAMSFGLCSLLAWRRRRRA